MARRSADDRAKTEKEYRQWLADKTKEARQKAAADEAKRNFARRQGKDKGYK